MYLMEVLNPVAQQRGVLEAQPINRRPSTLEGKTVGLLWSGTAMGDVALKRVGDMLKERFNNMQTRFYVGGFPAPTAILEKAATECDVVIGATAD
ncbi:hypothetical protein ACFLX9_00165 [Chloroflexota bacterium]